MSKSRERAASYGLDVRRLVRLLGVPKSEVPVLFATQGLPRPTESAVSSWITRNSISPQWLAVLLLALRTKKIHVDLTDFVENREIAGY
jgi:hypothetical protein